MDDCLGRTGPLGKGGGVVSERGVVDLVNEDAKESGSLIARVGLELRLDIENESRGDGREQTSLLSLSVRVRKGLTQTTHKDKSGI